MIDNHPINAATLESRLVEQPGDEVPYGLAITIHKTCLCAKGIYMEVEAPKDTQFKAYHFKTVATIGSGMGLRDYPILAIYLWAQGKESSGSQRYYFLIPKESLPDLEDFDWINFSTRQLVPYKVRNVPLGHPLTPMYYSAKQDQIYLAKQAQKNRSKL